MSHAHGPKGVGAYLVGQWGKPRGAFGWLVGLEMTAGNRARAEAVVGALPTEGKRRILEIGVGPGVALEILARKAQGASILGIDHSDVMVRMAQRRLARAGATHAKVHEASVTALPLLDSSFDLAYSINSYHHWDDPDAGIRELHRVLAPGGILVTALESGAMMDVDRFDEIRDLRERLQRACFTDLQVSHTAGRRAVTLIQAVKA